MSVIPALTFLPSAAWQFTLRGVSRAIRSSSLPVLRACVCVCVCVCGGGGGGGGGECACMHELIKEATY